METIKIKCERGNTVSGVGEALSRHTLALCDIYSVSLWKELDLKAWGMQYSSEMG